MRSNIADYVFTDPPFGANYMYSELNFLWEAWLKILTNNIDEAIVNNTQRKGLPEYQHLMEHCFSEYYRILKPGRWMTVEFHNSHNAVWNSIQEALQQAGFVVADVRTLDKIRWNKSGIFS
jgi:DNA modification methylase